MGGVWTDAAALSDTTEKAARENMGKMTERLTRKQADTTEGADGGRLANFWTCTTAAGGRDGRTASQVPANAREQTSPEFGGDARISDGAASLVAGASDVRAALRVLSSNGGSLAAYGTVSMTSIASSNERAIIT